jgi:hypothetical protein
MHSKVFESFHPHEQHTCTHTHIEKEREKIAPNTNVDFFFLKGMGAYASLVTSSTDDSIFPPFRYSRDICFLNALFYTSQQQ